MSESLLQVSLLQYEGYSLNLSGPHFRKFYIHRKLSTHFVVVVLVNSCYSFCDSQLNLPCVKLHLEADDDAVKNTFIYMVRAWQYHMFKKNIK